MSSAQKAKKGIKIPFEHYGHVSLARLMAGAAQAD